MQRLKRTDDCSGMASGLLRGAALRWGACREGGFSDILKGRRFR